MSALTLSDLNAVPTTPRHGRTTADELLSLGWEINANQYRLVHLAARFDDESEWFRQGHKSASAWIAAELQVQSSTAREWVRVGHALQYLPLVDAAFAAQEISFAKVRILTRWANDNTEVELLELARERNADRLSVAIARVLADNGETDAERDARLHEARSLTTYTDGDGMTVVRIVLPPSMAKPVVAAVDELVGRIARMPSDDAADTPSVTVSLTERESDATAVAPEQPSVGICSPTEVNGISLVEIVRQLERLQPTVDDGWQFPSLGQQRADAFVALFLGLGVDLTTEVVVHVRGDGVTFDDGTPTTNSAVLRRLDQAFIRLLIHDAERRPINASSRRRYPTTRQKRVVMEASGHECLDCQSTDLLELDHNPAYERSRRTVVEELEPRCAPCHRARHRVAC